MAEPRSLLEREMERVELRPFTLDGFYERRDRKRRNQRIAAGIVGIAVFAAAVALVAGLRAFDRGETPAVTGPSPSVEDPLARVGFIGLPPEGTTPSTPETGRLVISLHNLEVSGPRAVYVYADGRLIWQLSANLPEGANQVSTGFLEQQLTPEGIELLRSEVVSTGLFEQDLSVASGSDTGDVLTITVRNGDRLVRAHVLGISEPVEGYAIATAEQVIAFELLEARLTDLEAWLPTTAWEDREIRAYVPSRYSVCNSSSQPIGAARFLSLLPAAAKELLRPEDCSDVTSDAARELAAAFDGAGFEQDGHENTYRLEYHFLAPGPVRNTVQIWIEPILPHGETI